MSGFTKHTLLIVEGPYPNGASQSQTFRVTDGPRMLRAEVVLDMMPNLSIQNDLPQGHLVHVTVFEGPLDHWLRKATPDGLIGNVVPIVEVNELDLIVSILSGDTIGSGGLF